MTADILSIIPDNWGIKHESGGAAVAISQVAPTSLTMKTEAYYFLTLFNAQPERARALNSDRSNCGYCPAGSLEIYPIHSDLTASWSTYKESLFVGLSAEKIRSLAQCEYESIAFEFIPPAIGVVDKEAHRLSLQIRHEMQSGDMASAECIDALLTLLSIHMLRNHSSLSHKVNRVHNGGLAPATRRRVNDYIMANLREKITLQKMADIALLSPSHFARAFHVSVGLTPHQYVVNQRLSTARRLLSETTLSLEEVAKQSGFASNSQLSTTVRNAWGLTPTQLRRKLRQR